MATSQGKLFQNTDVETLSQIHQTLPKGGIQLSIPKFPHMILVDLVSLVAKHSKSFNQRVLNPDEPSESLGKLLKNSNV